MVNIGDVIFQLFAILIPIAIIVVIVFFVRSSIKRKEQLNRMEEIISGQNQKE